MGTTPKSGTKRKGAKGKVFVENVRRAWDLESLRFGDMFDTPEMEEALAMEALRRGADMTTAFKVVSLHRAAVRRSRTAHELRGLGTELSPLSGRLEFDVPFDPFPIWEEYRRTMRVEWERIPTWIQEAFDYDKKTKETAFAGVADDERRFTFYLGSRPLYYQNGYSRPVDQIFLKLSRPTFLRFKVGGGVSEAYVDALAKAEKVLASWNSPLVTSSTLDIKSIYGFVPRFIGGTSTLSNHAFGLAVDIDASTNPHLKKGEKGPTAQVFEVIEKITGVDFGESFRDGALPPAARAREIHKKQQEASAKLQRWLKEQLPGYISTVRAGRPKGKGPEWKEDEFTTSLPNQSTVASVDIKVLVAGYTLDGVKAWARGGIQTVPMELAAALVDSGMRWGSEYEHSKDVMHFELNPASKYLSPDSKPRPLTDLVLPGQNAGFRLISDEEWVRGRW